MSPSVFIAFFVIVVGIPVVGAFIVSIVKDRTRLRVREIELIGSETAEKAAQYAAHSERLEQRVRVLERIITDRGIAVADQIDQLRDLRN